MTREGFKKQIELFVDRLQNKLDKAEMYREQEIYRQDIALMKATIARTVRLCCQYPELAKEYFDSLPKATMD